MSEQDDGFFPEYDGNVSDKDFLEVVSRRGSGLLALAYYLSRRALNTPVLTRPLLGRVLSETAQLEELLDSYGARGNRKWHTFRHYVAAGKLFADAGYKLLHIQHSARAYQLLPVEGNFEKATMKASLFAGSVLMQIGSRTAAESERLGVPQPDFEYSGIDFIEALPPGRLPRDRTARKVLSAEETVAHLATAYLNLAAEGQFLSRIGRNGSCSLSAYFPTLVNEESLRQLEQKFHNLQSMYDTFVLDTDTESLDRDLCVLRGHISVIFHLLEIATAFAHYYERHVMIKSDSTTIIYRPLVAPDELLYNLFDYALTYANRYLVAARELSHGMLRRYAEIGSITVSVPRYRGFHVRPSTLLSKIAHHYGSEVRMDLGNERYDASSPLELFRANEKINAIKRRKLAEEVSVTPKNMPESLEQDMYQAVREIVTSLAAKGKLVIYERPLPLEDMEPHEGETITQFAVDEIARLLAIGKIDIESDVEVTFIADKRVLEDIRLLAENGYGEDSFGNNIPLPDRLKYLRL